MSLECAIRELEVLGIEFLFYCRTYQNGFPYGITWEDEKRNREKLADQRERNSLGEKLDDLGGGNE
ncbi:hypothetical protein ACFO8Q_01895 [Effusibacillus consociatus]|uniref:Uncharacterized protein n=1 Tax=Effusibacillus consociatus TaxID=1117041 RepID=A0ABV9Q0I6_9BACL